MRNDNKVVPSKKMEPANPNPDKSKYLTLVVIILAVCIVCVICCSIGFYFLGQSVNSAKSPLPQALSTTANSAGTLTTASDITANTTTIPLTFLPIPKECKTATNLTDPWRLEHNRGYVKGGGLNAQSNYTCDLRSTLQWFRFTGSAGKRILSRCPSTYSCGTINPIWTDEPLPKFIGQRSTIIMYGATGTGNSCKSHMYNVEVIRCSNEDTIYKYTGYYYKTCQRAFCGMN